MRNNQTTKNQRRTYLKEFVGQKLMGLGLLACCILVLWMCSTGTTPEDQDATALFLLVPIALCMLFSKK